MHDRSKLPKRPRVLSRVASGLSSPGDRQTGSHQLEDPFVQGREQSGLDGAGRPRHGHGSGIKTHLPPRAFLGHR